MFHFANFSLYPPSSSSTSPLHFFPHSYQCLKQPNPSNFRNAIIQLEPTQRKEEGSGGQTNQLSDGIEPHVSVVSETHIGQSPLHIVSYGCNLGTFYFPTHTFTQALSSTGVPSLAGYSHIYYSVAA